MIPSRVALAGLGLVVLTGCSTGGTGEHATGVTQPAYVDRVWTSTDPSAAPGSLRVFVSDGTLLMTSCVEVYRLARWRQIRENQIEWEEDGRPIQATIANVNADRLHLRLQLVSEVREEAYEIAESPTVCPDLPR